MSDMIDGLHKAALEAGQDASARLRAELTVADIGERVRKGQRRRRAGIAAASIAGTAAVVVGVMLLPALTPDFPHTNDPATQMPLVTSHQDGLTVFEDGSMAVETASGDVVFFEADDAVTDIPFKAVAFEQACDLSVLDFSPGWTYHAQGAEKLLRSASPQVLYRPYERTPFTSGATLDADADGTSYPLALDIRADARAASALGLRVTQYFTWVDPTGMHVPIVTRYDSVLDAQPTVLPDGNDFAVIQGRYVDVNSYLTQCYSTEVSDPEPYTLERFLVVDIFVMDRRGHDILIASHTSSTRTEVVP